MAQVVRDVFSFFFLGKHACACDPSTAEEGQRQEDGWGLLVSRSTPNLEAPGTVTDCLKGIRQVIQEDSHVLLWRLCAHAWCIHSQIHKKDRHQLHTALDFTHPSP